MEKRKKNMGNECDSALDDIVKCARTENERWTSLKKM